MNKSQRIYLDPTTTEDDLHLKVRLEQETDSLEFLSMSVDLKDAYQDFNADYGVLIGRVVANGGIGIPNAKISVFIPLSDEDASNSDIMSIYPYKTPRDKNNDGKRYNLLPRVSVVDPKTGGTHPKQPFGSFPIKEEVVTNSEFLDVYKKYYKYTALTNSAGDYMIFGVPTGNQTIHLSVDITDIGEYSMTPAAMVTNLGYSPNLFTDNNTKIKSSKDLGDLPNIETQEISVDIIPFWGDATNFEIGITRQDFRIRSVLANTFTIFGAAYTDGFGSLYGRDYRGGLEVVELYRISGNETENSSVASKRIGRITETIYYYPASVPDSEINSTIDPKTKMLKLDPTEYSAYKRDGDFAFIVNCNRKKVVTSETGEKISVEDDYPGGVFTEFRGFMTLEYTTDAVSLDFSTYLDNDNFPRGRTIPVRHKLKFPQSASRAHSFRKESEGASAVDDTQAWRRQHQTFKAGKFYGISLFHAAVYNGTTGEYNPDNVDGFLNTDYINVMDGNLYNTTGAIQTNDYELSGNSRFNMPYNALTDSNYRQVFVGNWMNFSAHMPQVGFLTEDYNRTRNMRSTSLFSQNFRYDSYYYANNSQPIVAGDFNTKFFARSDINWTKFIEVPETDVRAIIDAVGERRGFKLSELPPNILTGAYVRGYNASDCPVNGGKLNARTSGGRDSETYFFRGFDSSDCLGFLIKLGLVTP